MSETKIIQADLTAAQHDLERHVTKLKHLIEKKLETPRHVIEVAEQQLSYLRSHALLIGIGALLLFGLAIGRVIPMHMNSRGRP